MNRAELLEYRVVGGTLRVSIYENTAFRVEIANGKASVWLKRDFPSSEAAERVLADFFRSFEADCAFQGESRVDFELTLARMSNGETRHIMMRFNLKVAGPKAEEAARTQTPWRRSDVANTPLAGALLSRYESYKQGKENLATVAYVVLSALQFAAGGRKKAAVTFGIALEILDTMGTLSSEYGGIGEARKLDGQSSQRPLTSSEAFWLEAAMRRLILRAHESEVGTTDLREITSADLPSL